MIGQGNTPTERFKDKLFSPKNEKLKREMANVSSNENNFTPISSAVTIQATNNPERKTNNFTDLVSIIFLSINKK